MNAQIDLPGPQAASLWTAFATLSDARQRQSWHRQTEAPGGQPAPTEIFGPEGRNPGSTP